MRTIQASDFVKDIPDSARMSRLIFKNSPGCVKILDLNGNLLAMNENGRRIMEIDDFTRFSGQPWISFWAQEYHSDIRQALEDSLAGRSGKFFGFCKTAKGTPKWWNVHVNPLIDEAGQFDALIAVSYDVTELHEARQAMCEVNMWRDLSIQVGEIGEWSLNLETGLAICSRRHDACFGFSEPLESWNFDRFLNLLHPDDRERVAGEIRETIERRQSLSQEYRVIWPDGSVHWIASKGALYAPEGKPKRWMGVVQDITQRKRAAAIELGQKHAFESMVTGASLSEILDMLCEAAEQHSGHTAHAIIMLADPEEKMLRLAASPSLPDNFRRTLEVLPIAADSAACGQAAWRRQAIVVEQIADSTLPQNVKDLAAECGIRSCWATPIFSPEGRVLATFSAYYRLTHQPNLDDQLAVASLVNTAALIIDRHRQAEERQRAEASYREAQARLAATLAATEVATWTWDLVHDCLHADVNLQQMLALSFADIEAGRCRSFYQLVHPDDMVRVRIAVDSAIKSRQTHEIQYRMRSANDEFRAVLARIRAEYDPLHRPVRIAGVLLDITRQQQAETKLQISEERYHRLFRIMEQGFCVIEILRNAQGHAYDCRYIETNPAFEQQTGFANPIGKTFNFLMPGLAPDWIAKYSEVASSGRPLRFEYESKACGKWFDVHAACVSGSENLVSLLLTDISERKRNEQTVLDFNVKLEREANYDALTGLPNRRLFRERLAQQMRQRPGDRRRVSLMFLDLDNFKQVNDLLGHDAGDELLKDVAERLRAVLKIGDMVARLGGDEFTIILTERGDPFHLEQIAQRVLETLSRPYRIGLQEVLLSCSIGITVYPDDAATPEDMIRNADQAMYLSKLNGRNQLTFFQYSMHLEAMQRLKLIADLRQALPRNEIELYFQPINSLATGEIVKAEVLLRWRHPEHGLVSPSEFISLAEETGIIHEIGDWVFKESACLLKQWRDTLGVDLQLSINKSPKQFLKRGHSAEWVKHVRKIGLPSESLVIEITEGILINNTDAVSDNLQQLRDAGFALSIDDFGTGYSSMAYLKRLDIDYLKIDQSFIGNLMRETTDATIVESVIVMGHKLGLKIIAEGVEVHEQRDWLRHRGCDYMQGYLFSRPLPQHQFEELLVNTVAQVPATP